MDEAVAPPEAQVDAHLAAVRATLSRFIMKWSLVVNALWWVTDALTMGDIPGAVPAFVRMRLLIIAGAALVLLLLWRQTALDGPRFWACVAVWLAQFAGMTACIAAIDDLSKPWFHCTYPLLLASNLLPLGLGRRIVVTTLMGAALIVGFVWQRPEAVHSEYFAMTLGYLSFTVGVALAFGHRYELLTRDLYVQRLALEHNREVIRRQREDLRVQVDERTRELRLLAGHLDRAAESERQRIARELHDDLGQSVSALRLSLATTLRRHARDPASIGANLDDLDELVGRIADGTRDAVTRLRPRILDDRGLVHAAEWLVRSTARHTGLDVSLDVRGDTAALEPGEGEVRAASPAATAAFRVLQEALNNAVRHAQARRIAVRLEASEGAVLLEVRDDGVGLGAKRDGGMGLITMRERARALGGELTVGPGERAGVVVACRLPLEAA